MVSFVNGVVFDRIILVSLRLLGPIVLTLACAAANSDERPRFHLSGVDGPRGSTASAAVRINERGQISGMIGLPESIQVFRSGGRDMILFASLPGSEGLNIDYVADMNDEGVIIGDSPGYVRVQFMSVGETLERIPLPGTFNRVSGINNRGEIAGAYSTNQSTWTGFVYSNGVLRILPRLVALGEVATSGINNNGEVVGTASTIDTNAHTYTLHAVLFSSTGVTDLGTLPGDGFSSAVDLNDTGDIIGSSTGERGGRAFLYKDNVMREIEVVPPFISVAATAINNAGMVVGYWACRAR
jgi:probable HAF family extracellular repeat protein